MLYCASNALRDSDTAYLDFLELLDVSFVTDELQEVLGRFVADK